MERLHVLVLCLMLDAANTFNEGFEKVELTTSSVYEYLPTHTFNLTGLDNIKFTVQACNDAHITLQPIAGIIKRYVRMLLFSCNSLQIVLIY